MDDVLARSIEAGPELPDNTIHGIVEMVPNVVLPDPYDRPSGTFQLSSIALVSRHVTINFIAPVLPVCRRLLVVLRALVPKTTIDKYGDPFCRKVNIRLGREPVFDPVSITPRPKRFA